MLELVSIVLPVYNGEKYLSQSIESVLNQTYKNIELIIVNDCSTDSSEEIILKYKTQDNRIVYIKNEVNSKLPQSLNNGFAVAKGEYYSWTSDDNMYHNDAIEKMVEFLDKHCEAGMVYCDYNEIDEQGNITNTISVNEKKNILLYRNIIGACFLYRKSVAKSVGQYDASLFLVEDYEYWLRINLRYTILPLHLCLYDYRRHSQSLSETKEKSVLEARGKLFWQYLTEYEKTDMHENELVDYFIYILPYNKNIINRFFCKLKFALKHKLYFKIIIAKVLRIK